MAQSFQFGPLQATIAAGVKVGDRAPQFTAFEPTLAPFDFSTTAGRVRILNSVPSLDTGVCDTETRRFNHEAATVPGVEIYTISVDLPFAQGRWCGAAGIDKVKVLSDFNAVAFGQAYGTLMQEIRILSRATFVVDAAGIVVYAEYLPSAGQEPNYAAVLEAARTAAVAVAR